MRKSCHRTVRDPMGWITKRTPLAGDQQRDIGIAYHSSLNALMRGHGTEQAWSTLACAYNIALLLAEYGVSPNSIEAIKLAQNALIRTRDRALRTGTWAFDGDGARIIMAVSVIHDDQLECATRGQIIEALNEVHRRVFIGEAV